MNKVDTFIAYIKTNKDVHKLARSNFFIFANLVGNEIYGHSYTQKWQRLVGLEIMEFLKNNDLFFILNIPPRTGKSEFLTIMLNAFLIGQNTSNKNLLATASNASMEEMSLQIRNIMSSDIYKKIFPQTLKDLKGARASISVIRTAEQGGLWSCVSGSNMIGRGYNFMFFDDFLNPTFVNSEAKMGHAMTSYGQFLGRKEYKPYTKVFIVEQRVGLNDITAATLEFLKAGDIKYKHISLPYHIQNEIKYNTFTFNENTFLDSKFNEQDKQNIIATRCAYNSTIFETQYQQNPIANANAIFKRQWLQEIDNDKIQSVLTRPNILTIMSIDAATSEKTTADYTAILFFAYDMSDGTLFLLDVVRKKIVFEDLEKLTADLCVQHKPRLILVEDRSNGNPLLGKINRGKLINNNTGEPLKLVAKGIIPTKSKVERAYNSVVFLDNKRFFLPKSANWRVDFDSEVLQFPNGKNDDQVDSFTQCINYIESLRMSNARVSMI